MRLNVISISVIGEKIKFKIAFFRFFCEHRFIRTKVLKTRRPTYLTHRASCAKVDNIATVAVGQSPPPDDEKPPKSVWRLFFAGKYPGTLIS